MKFNSQSAGSRLISLLIVMLTLFSMCSIALTGISAAETNTANTSANLDAEGIASTGASGVSGNSSLFDSIDSQEPYVRAEKSSYAVDTPVLVTADTYGKYPDAVLALYEGKDKSTLASTDKPIYTLPLAGYEGQTIDIKTGEYHSDNTNKRPACLGYDLNYTAVIHPDASSTDVLCYANVNVDNAIKLSSGTDTLLEVSRKVYQYGEPIIVKGKTNTSLSSWLGVYKSGANPKKDAPIFIHLEGSNSNNGSNRYLNNISYTGSDAGDFTCINEGLELEVGKYDIMLFDSGDPTTATVLLKTSFEVVYSAVNTNKTEYGYGEDIISNTEHYVTSDYSIDNSVICKGSGVGHRKTPSGTLIQRIPLNKNVTIIPKSASTQVSGGPTDSNWAYLRYNSKDGYSTGAYMNPVAGADVWIYGTTRTKSAGLYSSNSTSSSKVLTVADGTPYNFLEYTSASWIKVRIGTYTGYLYRNGETNATNLYQYFDPHVNSDMPSVTTADARIGFYPSSVTPASGVSGYGYYYTKDSLESSMVIQDCGSGTQATPAGTYTFRLFGTSGYTTIASANVTISNNVTAKFVDGVYEVDNLEDGFANGRVAFAIDALTDYGYVGNEDTYAVVYWADSNGKPLTGYGSFNPVPLDKNVISFEMKPYTIIPEGATGLVAYIEYNGVKGEGLYLALPTGCKTYTGLGNGIISEFNVLSDSKVGNTNTSYHYDDHFVAALTDIANNGTNSQAIVINGDITNNGADTQFALIDSYASEVSASTGKTLPSIYGAHGNTDDNDSGIDNFVNFINSHGGNITAETPYYSLMVDGNKFIFLASDVEEGTYSTAQIEWLDAELADNEVNNGGKPVFIYSHYVVAGTVLKAAGGKVSNTDALAEVTKKYNNVFCFTGHGLASLRSLGNVFGGDETLPVVINASSTARTRRYYGTTSSAWEDYNNESSEGLYVRTYADKTVVMGRNFTEIDPITKNTGVWIPEALYVFQNHDVTAEDSLLMEFGESVTAADYITNPNGRTISGCFSEDTNIVTAASNGKITSADKKEGTTNVVATALATDTEVITRTKTKVRVVEVEDYSYYLMGSFNGWSDGLKMTASDDNENIVTVAAKLSAGGYELNLKSFDDVYGIKATINDATTDALILTKNSADNFSLTATGGTYTFTYNISTKELTVEHTPFTEDEVNANKLFELADTTDPYVYMSKDSYVLGESIYVTAQGGNWVGIYPATATTYDNTYSYYYYTAGKDGIAVDVRTLPLNGNDEPTDPARTAGSYKAVLFSQNNYTSAIQEVYFDVVQSNENIDYNNIISTDKETYFYGEDIMISGWTDRPDLKPWVAVVEHGTTPSSTNLPYWFYLPKDDTGVLNTPQNLIDVSEKNKGVNLEPGTYDVCLYRTGSYNYPRGYVTITVLDAAGSIDTNKGVYGVGEDVVVSVSDTDGSSLADCWVGIYDESVINGTLPTSGLGSQAWYYVYKQDSYAQVIQDVDPTKGATETVTTTGKAFHGKPGTYTAVLFETNDYSKPIAKKTFTITEDVTAGIKNGAYQVDNLTDGFANGRVALELDANALAYLGEENLEVTVYWAGADGKPLEGYTAFAKHYVNKNITVFDMNPYIFIPEGATGMIAYAYYEGVEGNEGYYFELPEGTKTYSGLDTGINSEFQIVADLQLGTDIGYDTQSNVAGFFTDVANNSENSSGIFVAGDATYNGYDAEFALIDSIKSSVEASTGKAVPPVYISHGDSDGTEAFVDYVNSHGGNVSVDRMYYSLTIDGYKYIFMATDEEGNKVSGEQIEWLDAELKANEANGGKPVFIIAHQQLEGALYANYFAPVANTAEVTAITQKYNNILYFSGHTLYDLSSDFSDKGYDHIFGGSEDMPVSVHAGSVGFSHHYDGADLDYTNDLNTGYYVRTYDDKIVLLARDFKTGKYIPDASYVIYNKDVQAQSKVEMIVDDRLSAEDYVTNSKGRELTFTSSDAEVVTVDAAGNLFAAGPGEAVITIFAKATDTEVITLQKVSVEVGGEGYPSKYHVTSMSDTSSADEALIYTADKDVVKVTVEFTPGEHLLAITKGEEVFGKDFVINDKTDGSVILNSTDAFTLNSPAGGFYTFTYRISTKELDIEHKPLDLTETGKNEATIYVDFKNSDFTDVPYIYVWEEAKDSVNKNIGALKPGVKLEGPNAEGYYYRTFKYDESYQFVISDGAELSTKESEVYSQSEVYVVFDDGLDYTAEKTLKFWVDATPNDPSDPIDRIYPVLDENGVYQLYLPSGYNTKKIKFCCDDGMDIKVSYIQLTPEGASVNLSGGVNKTTKYWITTSDTKNKIAQIMVKQSASVDSMFVYTEEMMPVNESYSRDINEYETDGAMKMLNSSATVSVTETDMEKVTGAADYLGEENDVIGKYSYNFTLREEDGKEYILAALTADESRLRSLSMIELAQKIGISGVTEVKPVDLYNDGYYIGSYLLIEKTENEYPTLQFKAGEQGFTTAMGQPLSVTSENVTAEELKELEAKWNEAELVIYNDMASYEELSAVIDVESFAKVYLMQELAKDDEAGAESYYVYYKDGKFYAETSLNFEKTLGQSNEPSELTDPEGWWAREAEIEGEGIPNAQAVLCYNDAFMNVVKAEWSELFYETALEIAPANAASVSTMTGTLKADYNTILKSIAMDEAKWGTIADDPYTGMYDTGDTHADATVYLNEFIYERLEFMNEELSKGYTLAEPTLKTDKEKYALNEVINLTAEIASSGELTYKFYDANGKLVYTEVTDKGYATYSFSTADEIEAEYTVVISSEKAEGTVSAKAYVITEVYEMGLKVEAPKEVAAGSIITLLASTNSNSAVEYILKDADGKYLNASSTGRFDIITSPDEATHTEEYIITATTTEGGIKYTESVHVFVDVIYFEFTVTLEAEQDRVEAGEGIKLISEASYKTNVKYTFYNAETMKEIAANNVGLYLYDTSSLRTGATLKFLVKAECEAFGNTFTATSNIIIVEVTEVTEMYNVTVYFKSTSTYGYRPMITTQGAVQDVEDVYMEKDIFITKNETETASYFWYKAEFSVSQKSPSVYIRILSSRYAMEVQTNLLLTEDKIYYFAVDNLNDGETLVDLTDASPDERNWCESAVHMVYDEKADGEAALAEISARVDLRLVGDPNADSKVNIRDATYIQKAVADIITMSETDKEVADMDDDLKVSVKDATYIQKKLAGIIKNSYEIGGSQYETN